MTLIPLCPCIYGHEICRRVGQRDHGLRRQIDPPDVFPFEPSLRNLFPYRHSN